MPFHRKCYPFELCGSQSGRCGVYQILALEVAKDGISVNAIAPGRVSTPRVRGHYSDEQWAEAMAQIPTGRAGTPDEAASTALFSFPTKSLLPVQTIHVNGAWLNY